MRGYLGNTDMFNPVTLIAMRIVTMMLVSFIAHSEFRGKVQNTGVKLQETSNKSFYGTLYPSDKKDKAIIVVSGSDGGIKWAQKIAKKFSLNKVTALAVAYWGIKDAPNNLSLVPIETVLSAVCWLNEKGYKKVGTYGVSKGAELALTSASFISQIEFVIAVSPACCVFEGIAKPSYSGTSSWTWKGEPLPYVSFKNISVSLMKNLFANHEFGF